MLNRIHICLRLERYIPYSENSLIKITKNIKLQGKHITQRKKKIAVPQMSLGTKVTVEAAGMKTLMKVYYLDI